jgi:glutamate-1-semialdehyde 2,1-aminomutase
MIAARAGAAASSSLLAGGASSPVRAGAAVGGAPFVQAGGRGAYAYDRDGRAYVDYVMAYGPLLFGHAHPALVIGLDELAARGSVFGSTHDEEVRLAERIAAHLPSMQSLRFVSTGTEAMMSALRVARAFTERPIVLRFAGNYHGHFDAALLDAGASTQMADAGASAQAEDAGRSLPSRPLRSGVTPGTRAETLVARYNDLANVDELLAGRETLLAAIALEPIVGNMGLVFPEPGFLDGIFERARYHGALVVFDEVITWLRLGLGGAQGQLGCTPDLTALGKCMGGGFPLGAFGGREDVMDALSPTGSAFTGGTFSGNPFCIGIGHRVLDLLERNLDSYETLETNARRLAEGMRAILTEHGLDYPVTQHASMVDLKFRSGGPIRNYDEAAGCDRVAFAAYYHAMRERGVLLAPSSNELMFLSSAHGPLEIERTLEAFDDALGELQRRGAVPIR